MSGGAGQVSQLAVTSLVGYRPLAWDGMLGEATLRPESGVYRLVANAPDIAHFWTEE